jgi:hypothetical protein
MPSILHPWLRCCVHLGTMQECVLRGLELRMETRIFTDSGRFFENITMKADQN